MKIFRQLEASCILDNGTFPLTYWQDSASLTQDTPPSALEPCSYFGYVIQGKTRVRTAHNEVTLNTGSYFSIDSGNTTIEGGSGVLIRVGNYRALNNFGGPLETQGRLKYIDGCTDTLLIPPVKFGDPCFNALYFPVNTHQTQHTHPSLRIGVVVDGKGLCVGEAGNHALEPGNVFIIAAEEKHAFHTDDSTLTVVAFHPDSDFGPKNEDHPMINKTLVNGMSAKHIPDILTE